MDGKPSLSSQPPGVTHLRSKLDLRTLVRGQPLAARQRWRFSRDDGRPAYLDTRRTKGKQKAVRPAWKGEAFLLPERHRGRILGPGVASSLALVFTRGLI